MKSKEIEISTKDIIQIKHDLALIKNYLFDETELTDWAKKELEEARKIPVSECVSHEEVGKLLFNK